MNHLPAMTSAVQMTAGHWRNDSFICCTGIKILKKANISSQSPQN